MTAISVIMPVYKVEQFVADAVRSVLAQTFTDFELLIIDDCSPDNSIAICEQFDDPRIRIIRHSTNRGLAGARNTGIRHARGELLAFLDSDDLWLPEKLERHVAHLAARPEVGVSFSRSAFINEDGSATQCFQMPRLTDIEPGYYLCRNPIGNGSAPVIRAGVFEQIRYALPGDDNEYGYFDEALRRSEDIECWIRIALTTGWKIEGIPAPLTLYRLNAGGLSASLLAQLASWEQVIKKTRRYAPEFVARWEDTARAYQLRYLARQAIRLHDGPMALRLSGRALATDARILWQEPGRTLLTLAAATVLSLSPNLLAPPLTRLVQRWVGKLQARRIDRDMQTPRA
ncbi:glycosyltransferase family 2 protein [Oceanimonas marisflavi]|uniref:glycosyltransferase family 2 protein n=1 Tax=Oceanimonas marisflavi TaxID=2059724 RepID=UPI000D30C4A1|nr:glycosyltransferase family 2 protein [Oceanimonas marisflavi]